MAITGKGKRNNHLGWLNKNYWNQPVISLIKTKITDSGQLLWNNWFFDEIIIPPTENNLYSGKSMMGFGL